MSSIQVGILMGSDSDWPKIKGAAAALDEFGIGYEVHVMSAHRTPELVEDFARNAQKRGIKVIIAAAGMAAHLPGVIAAMTPIPVIGIPVKSGNDGMDALFSIVQMPPGIPVATVGINNSLNAAILAAQILAVGDPSIAKQVVNYKENLKKKIAKANEELKEIHYKFKTN